MAKIVAEEKAPAKGAPAKGGKLGWVVAGLVCLLAVGGGFAVPLVMTLGGSAHPSGDGDGRHGGERKQALIPFGDVVVNVADGRYTRYLRVKVVLVTDEADEKAVTELLAKKKPLLQDWVNGYLMDQTMESVHGSAGKNRVRREIRDQFNAMLFSDGSEKIKDLLMTEFNFQ
jgi:flagellar basal body-associated protein FliL